MAGLAPAAISAAAVLASTGIVQVSPPSVVVGVPKAAEASVSVPVRVRKTIWSASPACAGNLLWSRSTARCESVLGSEMLFALRFPTAWEAASTPAARTIHASTTRRR